jgi:hypothetical protein
LPTSEAKKIRTRSNKEEKTMEKYVDLEQALQDPSLAIISDQITTLSELNSVYLKYRVLSSIQKRFSNYYSNEFLGHSVPEMYILVKDKLKPESDVFEDWQLPNETLIVSEPDLYYKEESFNSGDTNICFVLGYKFRSDRAICTEF